MTQIQIEIVNVGSPETVPTKNGKSYQTIEVAYKKDGKIEGKKIMSFTNPLVFKAVQGLTPGETVFITTEKNDKGYWQWEGITKEGSAGTQSASSTMASGGSQATQKASGGTWETKEERAARQVMIVRQSSLTNAIATLSVGAKALKPGDVIEVAQQYESYVLSQEAPKAGTAVLDDDFPDDIPL